MRPPMRSSIACTRCRKSKIKCENDGGKHACDSCIKTGKECFYKIPDPVPPKRSEPPAAVKQERDGGSDRKKLKKIDDISKVDNQRATAYAEEVLAAPFLTEDMWEQVFDLYKLHFGPELSFLHLPTMKEKLGRKFRTSESENGTESNLVLLGVLTLTARFHPELVKYLAHICNNQPGNARTRPIQTQLDPAAASEYYADILAMALGPVRTAMGIASVERVAALLMLGLYEWSQTRPKTGGLTAWMYIGAAIRMAQFLGLGFGDAPGVDESRYQIANQHQRSSGHQSQMALQKEIKRRIMFSCFILDRMLACGRHRVTIIHADDLQIQLPCSEDKFDLAMEVQTGFLTKPGRFGTDDSVLGRFIRLVDIWGDISKFSSRGGRLTEDTDNEYRIPPWDQGSRFYQLDKRLQAFDSDLPGTFTFSRSNYFKHENHQASSAYVLLHMLRCVCLIMLHREYVPFIPIRCKGPEGPLDEPTFERDEFSNSFWRASAEQLFKAARGIVDLIKICQRKDKLPQSTIVLFAIWNAAFVGLYGFHFPQMDTERHMLSFDDETHPDGHTGVFEHGPTGLTFETLQKMSNWLKMASAYVDLLEHMDKYFVGIKQDYYKYKELNMLSEKRSLRVREGGTGGGLEEYHRFAPALKGFGPPIGHSQPDETDHADSSERSRTGEVERPSSRDAETMNAAALSSASRSAPPGSFTAINHSQGMPTADSPRPFSRAASIAGPPAETYADSWRYHSSTPQQQQQQQQHSPSQAYPTPSSMLDPATIAAQAHDRTTMQDESDKFYLDLKKAEPSRFGIMTGDLGLFSTGESQLSVSEMPFGDAAYMPAMGDSAYQYLQQASEY
ncbi:Uu.00g018540.m01.CDS01 [Anthostomella pinea]|uniref:Uu.00g018540.m01.CDS01 n=1 Tax=Anthostomella pinea TaxID=933095 RepID=A0AAI8VZP1_9PEZI|nr:Uu.00g018540.m01.CDS01 [Anthostomella pinea]